MLICALLHGDRGLIPEKNGTSNQATQQEQTAPKRNIENIPAPLARGFAVRKQIDQNHCMNLRKAKPQEVR